MKDSAWAALVRAVQNREVRLWQVLEAQKSLIEADENAVNADRELIRCMKKHAGVGVTMVLWGQEYTVHEDDLVRGYTLVVRPSDDPTQEPKKACKITLKFPSKV